MHRTPAHALCTARALRPQRYDYKDHVALYDTATWREVAHVTCDTTDATDLKWSPDGRFLAVWDSCLSYR